MISQHKKSALKGLRVLDMSRVLAGPFCTQTFGDLGAEILKIEKPGSGDDTRKWGPPFLKDADDNDTTESAYYLSANRNKHSLAIDFSQQEGQQLIKEIAAISDVFIENFQPGKLAKYGLTYEDLRKINPGLVYCSISGFGQTGPEHTEPGYDFMAQAFSGLMSVTGETDGNPMKVGVALSDIITGLYASISILAALRHRDLTGEGQYIDLGLTDCTLASLSNLAQFYLTSGETAPRFGNAHSAIVPYQSFETSDRHIIIAVGNDTQFSRLCEVLGHKEWALDSRFKTNQSRVKHRQEIISLISEILKMHPGTYWLSKFRASDIPSSLVQNIEEAFSSEQIKSRDMKIEMRHPQARKDIKLVGSPIKLSQTPVSYTKSPPICGEDTVRVLQNLLGLSEATIQNYTKKKIIG
ncbi:MAG: CoA transferase [Alphaproteobacteria bacterium]|nr:CoA transferase [Alphaproteobacteria bacterium]|tara:strand:+ start:1034 stop:2266 length:1233 start_codon:yes stop_codon:yes gene_type:complete